MCLAIALSIQDTGSSLMPSSAAASGSLRSVSQPHLQEWSTAGGSAVEDQLPTCCSSLGLPQSRTSEDLSRLVPANSGSSTRTPCNSPAEASFQSEIAGPTASMGGVAHRQQHRCTGAFAADLGAALAATECKSCGSGIRDVVDGCGCRLATKEDGAKKIGGGGSGSAFSTMIRSPRPNAKTSPFATKIESTSSGMPSSSTAADYTIAKDFDSLNFSRCFIPAGGDDDDADIERVFEPRPPHPPSSSPPPAAEPRCIFAQNETVTLLDPWRRRPASLDHGRPSKCSRPVIHSCTLGSGHGRRRSSCTRPTTMTMIVPTAVSHLGGDHRSYHLEHEDSAMQIPPIIPAAAICESLPSFTDVTNMTVDHDSDVIVAGTVPQLSEGPPPSSRAILDPADLVISSEILESLLQGAEGYAGGCSTVWEPKKAALDAPSTSSSPPPAEPLPIPEAVDEILVKGTCTPSPPSPDPVEEVGLELPPPPLLSDDPDEMVADLGIDTESDVDRDAVFV